MQKALHTRQEQHGETGLDTSTVIFGSYRLYNISLGVHAGTLQLMQHIRLHQLGEHPRRERNKGSVGNEPIPFPRFSFQCST